MPKGGGYGKGIDAYDTYDDYFRAEVMPRLEATPKNREFHAKLRAAAKRKGLYKSNKKEFRGVIGGKSGESYKVLSGEY